MRRAIPTAIAAAFVAGAAASAQAPRVRTLAAPDAEFREPFTSITSVRELSDGRVIVTDRSERTVQLIDFAAGKATPISRTGGGPDEYGLPGRLFALNGDTTLLSDGEHLRYLLIAPGGRALESFAFDGGGDRRLVGMATAATRTGAFYFIDARYTERPNPIVPTETELLVLRRARGHLRVDTVATLAVPPGRYTASRDIGNGSLYNFNSRPLAREDAVAFAADGRVAVVRASDYHVEWIHPDGRVVKGPPVAYEPIRVTDAERKAFIASQTRPGRITVFRPEGGGVSARGGGPPPPQVGVRSAATDFLSESNIVWPAEKAPFFAGAASVTNDGRVWVLRSRAHTDSVPVYDVFDERATLVDRVALPKGARLVGFGTNTVYVARTDADDLQYLQRYRR